MTNLHFDPSSSIEEILSEKRNSVHSTLQKYYNEIIADIIVSQFKLPINAISSHRRLVLSVTYELYYVIS